MELGPRRPMPVLTEDSGRDGHATVLALVTKMFRLLEASCETHRIAFEPRNAADLTTLWATIATRLATGDFVFFHVDGDRRWSERASSEHAAKFDGIVRTRVRNVLRAKGVAPAKVDALMGRLFAVMPYYSIESWLFQNTRTAIELCRTHHDGRDVERLEAWALDRRAFDEIDKPKESLCLRDQHNLALARSAYYATSTVQTRKSLTPSPLQPLATPNPNKLTEEIANWRSASAYERRFSATSRALRQLAVGRSQARLTALTPADSPCGSWR